jgi:hypothetical protein
MEEEENAINPPVLEVLACQLPKLNVNMASPSYRVLKA